MAEETSITPIFTGIKEAISKELQEAKYSILVAVAWFTDVTLFDILIKKANEGVNVELIVADVLSQNALKDKSITLPFHDLIEAGAKVYYMNLDFKQLMHHKFCVIDFVTLVTGSFNWTYKASLLNFENILIIKNSELVVNRFSEEFMKLKRAIMNSISVSQEVETAFISKIIDFDDIIYVELSRNRTVDDKPFAKAELRRDSSAFQKLLLKKTFLNKSSDRSYVCLNLSVAIRINSKIDNNTINALGELESYSILGFSPEIVEAEVIEIVNDFSEEIIEGNRITFEQGIQNVIVKHNNKYGRMSFFERAINKKGIKIKGQFTELDFGNYKEFNTLYFDNVDETLNMWGLAPQGYYTK